MLKYEIIRIIFLKNRIEHLLNFYAVKFAKSYVKK